MNPEMSLVGQVGENRIRKTSITHLDRVAVLNKPGYMVADALRRVIQGDVREFQEGLVVTDHEINILDVDETVAVNAGHFGVDLSDDHGRLVRGGLDHIHTDPETHITVLVGETGLHQRHIDLDGAAFDQGGHVGKGNGRIVGKPLIDGAAGVVPDKKGVVAEIAFEFRVGIGSDAERIDMDDLGVKKGLGIGFHIIDHGPDKILRLAAAGGDKDVIPPADVRENSILLGEFFGV